MSKSPDPPPPRRRFFRQALKGLFETAEEVVQWQQDLASSWMEPPTPRRPTGFRLRPPGAVQDELFGSTCERSGHCVTACPVQAIQVKESLDEMENGTPFILASEQACVVCDELSCMKACPSGALVEVPKHEIRMGLALVDETVCRRSFGDDCTECVDRCPLGTDAIDLAENGTVRVHDPGCIGCGVCEFYCPTSPRAIRIVPR